jgi:hypothetical protein
VTPRRRILLIAGLFGIALIAWIVTAELMDGMDSGPGADLGHSLRR